MSHRRSFRQIKLLDTAQKQPEAKEEQLMPRIVPYSNLASTQQPPPPKLNDTNSVFSPNNMTVNLNQMMMTGGSEFNAQPPLLSHMDLSQYHPFKDNRMQEAKQ